MTSQEQLAEQFEEHRHHLRGVAYRMLGSVDEADDAVQEAWLRLSRTDTTDVLNLRGWLTTVVSQPRRLATSLVSERASLSQASCTASSASATEPSIR